MLRIANNPVSEDESNNFKQLMVLMLRFLLKLKSFINVVDADNGSYSIVCSVVNQNHGNLILKTKNQNFRA